MEIKTDFTTMNTEDQIRPIKFRLDYTDSKRVEAGWLPCYITTDSQEVCLCASAVYPFLPLDDLCTFLENLSNNHLPCHFYWDEEGTTQKFEAMPLASDNLFRFRLTEFAGFSSAIYEVDETKLTPSITIDQICDRREFLSTFLASLEEVCQGAPDLVIDEWQIDCERINALKILNQQKR